MTLPPNPLAMLLRGYNKDMRNYLFRTQRRAAKSAFYCIGISFCAVTHVDLPLNRDEVLQLKEIEVSLILFKAFSFKDSRSDLTG